MPVFTVFAAAAAVATAPAPETRPPSLQQQFNEATELAISRKCTEAVPRFEALEHDPRVKPGSFPAATIAVRKGICLVSLNRDDEGEKAIATGLPALLKAGPDFQIDVSDARLALGNAAFGRSDYVNAAGYFRRALENRTGAYRVPVLARLAKATAFDGDAAALAPAEEALKILAAEPKPDKQLLASLHTLHARTLLNQGRTQEAYEELKQALSLSGGLTLRTSLDEVSLRSDLAMAAMLVGRKDDARRYLAYTGAGRIQESSFTPAESMDPPLCGSETGLRPEDVAVVEFGIGKDGFVTNARTVYSRGGTAVAAAFERAVRQWSWKPEEIAKIPLFYQLLTRIEVRCSTASGNRPGLWSPFNARFMSWAEQHLPALDPADTVSQLSALHRIADDEKGAPLTRIAAFGALARLETIASDAARVAFVDKALALATTTPVPPETVNWLRVTRSVLETPQDGHVSARSRQSLLALAAEPQIAKDALAADSLRLSAAGTSVKRQLPQSDALIQEVAGDDRLEPTHPLRQLAWLTLANKAAAAGDVAAAQAKFANTGLTEEQCALLSLPPAIRRTNVSSSDYPMSAAQMGFEGWVRIEYDINADGTTAGVRPIVAYPALIFVEAATSVGKNLRYEWSYRPGGATACSANATTINFRWSD